MSFSVASCCMFCPPVSCAFATSGYWPIATAPSSCSAAAPICRPSLPYRSPPPRPSIFVNTAIAAPCVRWRFFPPSNFPLGCPTPLPRRTLHDHRPPAHPHQPCPLPHSLWPNQTCAYCFNPAISDASPIALSKTFAFTIPASSLPTPLLRATYSAPLSAPTTPEPHSKHIIPTGGFAQPVLSPVFRPEAVAVIADQVAGLNTGDSTLVGYHSLVHADLSTF